MSTPQKPPASPSAVSDASSREDEQPGGDDTITLSDREQRSPLENDQESMESEDLNSPTGSVSPRASSPLADVPSFDWEQFEARYESALKEADEEERGILQEAQSLSKVPSPIPVQASAIQLFHLITRPGNDSTFKRGHLLPQLTTTSVLSSAYARASDLSTCQRSKCHRSRSTVSWLRRTQPGPRTNYLANCKVKTKRSFALLRVLWRF